MSMSVLGDCQSWEGVKEKVVLDFQSFIYVLLIFNQVFRKKIVEK